MFLVSAVHMGWSQVELKQPDRDSRKGGSQSTSKHDYPKMILKATFLNQPIS